MDREEQSSGTEWAGLVLGHTAVPQLTVLTQCTLPYCGNLSWTLEVWIQSKKVGQCLSLTWAWEMPHGTEHTHSLVWPTEPWGSGGPSLWLVNWRQSSLETWKTQSISPVPGVWTIQGNISQLSSGGCPVRAQVLQPKGHPRPCPAKSCEEGLLEAPDNRLMDPPLRKVMSPTLDLHDIYSGLLDSIPGPQ